MTMCDYCIHHDCNQHQWHIKAVVNGDMYCQAFRSWTTRKISFNMTTAPFVTFNKTETRRNWQPVTVKRFAKDTKFLGVQRCYGGEVMGVGQVTKEPFKQCTDFMGNNEYHAEGFAYLDNNYKLHPRNEFTMHNVLDAWKRKAEIRTVVPFKILEVFPGMVTKYTTDDEIKRCVKALVRAIG